MGSGSRSHLDPPECPGDPVPRSGGLSGGFHRGPSVSHSAGRGVEFYGGVLLAGGCTGGPAPRIFYFANFEYDIIFGVGLALSECLSIKEYVGISGIMGGGWQGPQCTPPATGKNRWYYFIIFLQGCLLSRRCLVPRTRLECMHRCFSFQRPGSVYVLKPSTKQMFISPGCPCLKELSISTSFF